MQKTFSFAVRDSFINVGPVKDFAYGLRINADANAMGIAKQSNYELVSTSVFGRVHMHHNVLAGVKASHVSLDMFKMLLLYNYEYCIIIPCVLERLISAF